MKARDRPEKTRKVDRAPKGGFLAFRNDRLGGRLNAILTAMRLARRYDAPLRIFWPKHEDSSIELRTPEDLFSAEFIGAHFVDKVEGLAGVRRGIDIGAVASGLTEAALRAEIEAGVLFLSNSATEQLRLPFEPREVLADLPALLHDMPFTPRIREMIDKIDAILGKVSFRSYHLRRGDIIDDASLASHNLWPSKYIPRVIYEWHMQRQLLQGDGMIVVFSDAQAEARAFSALSPRIKSFPELIGDEDLTLLQRDFLELYTMSRSEKIFAPPSSAFSGMAAVLGNTTVVDIEADLSPGDRAAAMDELVDRLENRPEVFLSQSDTGQNFPFITEHLTARGEAKRAQSIILAHVERGLDRAYVYPFLSERMLAEGNLDSIDRLLELASDRPCYRDEHWSLVFTHAALADLLRGRTKRAIRRYHVGQWFYPINKLSAETFWYLAATGDLTQKNTFPFDPGLFRKTMRSFRIDDFPSLKQLTARLAELGKLPQQYPSNIDVRDWRRLMGKKLSFSFANHSRIERQVEALAQQFRKDPDAAAFHSAKGALLSATENWKGADTHLQAALEKDPVNPLYLKRLAQLRSATGSPEDAVTLLEKAVEHSGGTICYRAELALTCLEAGQKDRYATLMRSIRSEDTDLVEIKVQVAEYLRRQKETLPELPGYLDELLALAPGSQRILTLKSKAYEQLGQFDAALDLLRGLKAVGRPESVVRSKVEGLFKAYRRAHDQKTAIQWCRENGISDDFTLS